MPLTNATMANHAFLRDMFDSTYYPQDLVQKGKDILVGAIMAEWRLWSF